MYKEQACDVGEMMHEHETDIGRISLNTKQRRIKLEEKLSIVVELGKVTFLGCTHGSIWVLNTREEHGPNRWVLCH